MPQGVHTSKRKSGFQQRKAKQAKLSELDSISGSLLKYVKTEKSENISEMSPDIENFSDSSKTSINSEEEQNDNGVTENDLTQSNNFECNEIKNDGLSKTDDFLEDISHWNIPLSSNCRVLIINKGSGSFQNKEGPFKSVLRKGTNVKGETRQFSREWFFKEMTNGDKILRTWMVYSPISNQIYCFCCRLFCSSTINASSFVTGFQNWWKLNPKVVQHENSEEHIKNLEKWKTFESGLKLQKTIDSKSIKLMDTEKKKWRNILTRLLDITLFLSKQNLAFRGHEESENSTNKGNFLEMVELLSKYDVVLKEHMMNLNQHVTYLSPETQNEFINVLASHVRNTLIEEIKSAGYFGMMFDSTPDSSHVDQMSEIIRYVKIKDGKVEVKEVFLRFFPLKGKKAVDLSSEILENLQNDGLDIMMCRSQGYDNAATMSGVHNGVQTILKSKNKKAVFNGCVNHSVNLCGVHSFAENASCVLFFGTLEQIYVFFSASTHRWDVLLKHCGCTVKKLSTTRWSAHYASVKVVAENFDKVVAAIKELCDPQENLDTRGAAQSLLPAVCNYTFLCFLYFWSDVLKQIDCTQVYLQTKGLSLEKVVVKLETLRLFIHEERSTVVEKSIERAKIKSNEYDIITNKRIRFKRRLAGEQARDVGLTLEEENRRCMIECMDRFHSELETRSKAIKDIASKFEAIQSENLLFTEEKKLKALVEKLTDFYDEVAEVELLLEIPRIRRHLKAAKIDLSEAKDWNALDFLKFIVKWDFVESLPNLALSLKLLLTICVSVASCERSFSKLKLIKDYLRSTMSQTRLNDLAILSIERETSANIDFEEIINDFASRKARRVQFI